MSMERKENMEDGTTGLGKKGGGVGRDDSGFLLGRNERKLRKDILC